MLLKKKFLTEQEIREAMSKDQELSEVMRALKTGEWPKELRKFQHVAADLCLKAGIISILGCAVVPESLRRKALDVAHEDHPSVAKLKSMLRERVWWPRMSGDAENPVRPVR